MPSSQPAPAPPDLPQVETAWSRALRKLLPAGAPVPDEDHLNYSFSVVLPADAPSWGPRTPTSCSSAALPPLPRFGRHRRCISRILRPDPPLRAPSPPSSPDTISPASSTPRSPRSSPTKAQPLSPQPLASDLQVASEPGGKRRACARCSRGGIRMGILEEQEECLACGARHCPGCVLRAMGSMPEGHKCVGSIAQPVTDAQRRARLGKGSPLLARLLAPAEVRQVMRAERGCASNRVRPDEVVVNGRGLSQGDLDLLLGCSVPPGRLMPGKYWYDKDSGLWGKEGQRPDRIVSSKLSVGGKLREDASNGTTQVFMNGREITKTELMMLKVQDARFYFGAKHHTPPPLLCQFGSSRASDNEEGSPVEASIPSLTAPYIYFSGVCGAQTGQQWVLVTSQILISELRFHHNTSTSLTTCFFRKRGTIQLTLVSTLTSTSSLGFPGGSLGR